MPETVCPAEHELLALIAGEPAAEVQRHLGGCPDCRQRAGRLLTEVLALRAAALGLPAATAAGPWPTPVSPVDTGPAPAPEPRPATVGKYVIVGALDEGGQALVYRAVHPVLSKEVVIKLGRNPCAADQAERDRLVAEGRLLADLEHPNLARVHDLDFYHDRPFVVLEYVRGPNLEQYAQQQRLAPRTAALLVAKLARALAAAHRRGVAHLDVKPRNVLIDEAGEPRLIDFGLARLRHPLARDLDQPGSICGTLAYMAPEQARGETDRVGPVSDLFALGGVLYYLLVGKAPYRGKDARETLDRARRGDWDREALRQAGVPRRLRAICERALAPTPADRYQQAEDLAADLERFARGPRGLVTALAVVATLLLAAFGGWWLVRQGTPSPPPDAPPLIQVYRGGRVFELRDALPLRSGDQEGDRLQLSCDLPLGYHAALFWLDSEGKLLELTANVEVSPAGSRDRLVYPRGGVVRLRGPPGTELVLVCAHRSGPIRCEEVAQLFEPKTPLPALPARVLVVLRRDGIEVVGERALGPVEANPVSEVRQRLDRLRLKLRERFEFVSGVAFSQWQE
jgi:tRNA A-37 threonylcarbamoyl transferase component Bud32